MTRYVLVANGQKSQPAQGRFVFIEAATGDVEVIATLNNGERSSMTLRARDQARFDDIFSEVTVRDISGAANTVDIKTGFAQYIPRQDGGPVQITGQDVPLDVSAATVTVDFAAPPQVQINGGVDVSQVVPDTLVVGTELTLSGGDTIAANADRQKIIIKAPLANSAGVWLSSATGNGIMLDPGEKIELVTTGQIDLTEVAVGDKIQYMETEQA